MPVSEFVDDGFEELKQLASNHGAAHSARRMKSRIACSLLTQALLESVVLACLFQGHFDHP
jgi:hypothetical protein